MRRYKKAILAGIVAGTCAIGGTAWAFCQSTSEKQEVKRAFVGSQTISCQIGQFESDNGKTDDLLEEQIRGYIDNFDARMDRYYARDNICRQTYKETNETILREAAKDEVCYLADGGVLDCTFQNVSISKDGQTATVQATCVTWGNWIEENENQEIEVIPLVGRDDISATMTKEDGVWKLEKIDDMRVATATNILSETQEDLADKTYDTFEEALAVAESLDPEEISSLQLWWNGRDGAA